MRGLWLGAALVTAFALAGCQTGGLDRPDMRSTAQEVQPGSYTGVWVAADGSPGRADSELELDTATPDRVAGTFSCRGCQGMDYFTLSFDVPRDGDAFEVPTATGPMEFVIVGGEIRGRFGPWVIIYT